MTINKAIEILGKMLVGVEAFDDPDEPDAIKLGIEALKWELKLRQSPGPKYVHNLPGETK